MATEEPDTNIPAPDAAGLAEKPRVPVASDHHPSGKESYGRLMQLLRGLTLGIFFNACIVTYAFISQSHSARQGLKLTRRLTG